MNCLNQTGTQAWHNLLSKKNITKIKTSLKNQLGPRYEGQLMFMAEPIAPSKTSPSYALTTFIIFRYGRTRRDR